MELVLGGLAAVGAGLFSNPLEVVKIRMQLQGELKSKGNYAVHYRNVFHAAYTIATKDGVIAIQKGLVPALWFQWVMNGTRLGLYQVGSNHGLTKNKDGSISVIGSMTVAAAAGNFPFFIFTIYRHVAFPLSLPTCEFHLGALGATVGSPFFLIKTHLQSHANDSKIAVGHQHQYKGLLEAFRIIYKNNGILGFWRGCTSSLPRVVVASSVQLLTFDESLQFIKRKEWFSEGSWLNPFGASMVAGLFVSFFMAPFDLMSTRFYNQGIGPDGKGLLYKNVFQCGAKIYKAEGILGFFKGWTANYFRLGPHTLLCLVFWDQLKYYYKIYNTKN